MGDVVFSDEKTLAFAESLAPLVDGPRVRVLSSQCQRCGEYVWIDDEVGSAFTVAAAVLHEMATQPHSDDCDGQMQFETEPAPPESEEG